MELQIYAAKPISIPVIPSLNTMTAYPTTDSYSSVGRSIIPYINIDTKKDKPILIWFGTPLSPKIGAATTKEAIRTNINKKYSKLLSEKVYEQAVGFMRVVDGENPLDKTNIHTESYEKTEKLLKHLNMTPNDIGTKELISSLDKLEVSTLSKELDIDMYTLNDIIESLKQPNRDYRDDYEMPLLKSDILTIDNLTLGMKLEGTVRNVVDFGAFIDIGLHSDGLVHISKITNKYIKHPSEVLSVGDIVSCYVIDIKKENEKVSLSLIDPNNQKDSRN